jgi:hypothetical protein
MKKSLLSPLLFFLTHGISGQITKNNWMLGGSISFSSTNFNSENYGAPHQYGDLKINPNVGYFLIDRLSVGIKTGIEKSIWYGN